MDVYIWFRKILSLSKDWLGKREHYHYDWTGRLNYLIKILFVFVASTIGLNVFYSNALKLNQIELWIINLGGLLLSISLFFAIKFGWRLGKELINILKRQRNWLRCLILIFIIISLWEVNTNRETVFNPVFNAYNAVNLSYFKPLEVNGIALDSADKKLSLDYVDKQGNQKTTNINLNSPLKPEIEISALELQINNLINQERTINGLSELTFDNTLANVARLHSQDMSDNNFFAHINLKGQDPTNRANAESYNCFKDYGDHYTNGIAENIFQNNLYTQVTYVDGVVPIYSWSSMGEIASSTVQGWMNSPGHRQNILTPTYDREGIGIAISSDYKVYITQDFC